MTLRHRMLAYMALVALASCTLTVGVAVLLLRQNAVAQREANLLMQAKILGVIGGAAGGGPPGQRVYRVTNAGPRPVTPSVEAVVLRALPAGSGRGTITVGGHPILYVARETPAGRIVLFRPGELPFVAWRPALTSLVLAGLGGVALAAVLAYVVARRITRPIGALASATERLSVGETGVEVPVQGADEVADLGRAFNTMSRELARARDSQRLFLESVSHELKTPLTSIKGYAEAVREGAVAAPEGGAVIAGDASRLERLVSDLIELARAERAAFAVRREAVDLHAVAAAAVKRHARQAEELGVGLELGGDEPALAHGDEERLLQATSNLIENALRVTPSGGTVTVAAAPGRLSVSDTGPGLEPADLPHAFERFYLHERYRSERKVGSGLGLAIVKELTEAMGGKVTVANRPDRGAVFTLALPAVDPDPPRTRRPARVRDIPGEVVELKPARPDPG